MQTSSRSPKAIQACRGNAPKDGTPSLTLSNRKDLHDARRCIQERGEDLQDPQQDVHRVPPPGSTFFVDGPVTYTQPFMTFV